MYLRNQPALVDVHTGFTWDQRGVRANTSYPWLLAWNN